ncbi:hypothetical protein ABGV42_01190 [Paenibacillus pabuli]|uniref:hypothetical protein n=1 Tax=Paenibacillus pabuli TaxID=1472 RepID=UPI003241FB2F
MRYVEELIRVKRINSRAAKYVRELVGSERISRTLVKEEVDYIFSILSIPFESLEGHDLRVFYSQYGSSGYSSTVFIDEGEIRFYTAEPEGLVTNSFTDELILFEVIH